MRYAAQHFPKAAYKYTTSIVFMLHNLKDKVIRKAGIEQEDLYAHKIGLTPRQTATIFSFTTKYPKQFERSKDSIKT